MHKPLNYCTFFHNNLCHVCKTPSNQLKICGSCKTIAYCSKDHQKQDWKMHKALCKVIAQTEEDFRTIPIKTYEEFQTIRYLRCTAWQNRLKRPLENFENQMWMFPRVCGVCYSKDVKIDCRNCLTALYCSTEHQKMYEDIHKHYCDSLKLSVEFDMYQLIDENELNIVMIGEVTDEIKTLPNNLFEFIKLYNKDLQVLHDHDRIRSIKICDYGSPVANILYCLEQNGVLVERKLKKTSLIVHLVGADIVEVSWDWTIVVEMLIHWIKNLESVTFVLIGPDLESTVSVRNIAGNICQKCKTRNVKVACTFYSNMYHDIVDDLDQPDVVVAFNSGLHAYDESSWGNSINLLTKYNKVPLLLTAYTSKELQCDVDIVLKNSSKLKMILEPQKNPFSCMRPMRDFNTLNVPIFYVNGYIAIFTKAVED